MIDQGLSRRPAVFFDRDGVINEPPDPKERYLRHWKDFRFIQGIVAVLRAVKRRGFLTVLVSNQQGVGKGLMTVEQLADLHESMQKALRRADASFDAIYVATGLAGEDSRRKPAPSMLLEAAAEHGIHLQRSWMVGDHDNDMRAGRAAGVGTIRVIGGKAVTVESDYQVRDAGELGRLFDHILGMNV